MSLSRLIFPLVLCASVGLIFAAVHFGGGAFVSDIAGSESAEIQPAVELGDLLDQEAPYFDLPNISGQHIRLSDFNGEPLVLVFWSTWNNEAADQIQILDNYLAKQTGEDLVKIVAIDSQEDKSVVASFIRRGGYQIPTLVDAQGATSEEYHIKSLPTTFFIARDGVVRAAYTGVMSERMLVEKIEQIVQ